LPMTNCASPSYLRQYGVPRSLADLEHHFIVHYAQGNEPAGFEYQEGDIYRERPMRSRVTVNSADAYQAACAAGLGIIQAPRAGLVAKLGSGVLVEVLPELRCEPMPVSLIHAHGRNVPRRVRAVMNWLARVMEPTFA